MTNPQSTHLEYSLNSFGESENGLPLQWIPPRNKCRLLLLAGLHGEECDTTVALSRALRSLPPDEINAEVGVILCANPDGMIRGTRGNAKGVDLNRNFPTANWQAEPTTCRWFVEDPPEKALPISTGTHPGSEKETQALISLLEEQQPEQIISLHGPLACIDDPQNSVLGQWIAAQTNLPLVGDIGYPTPGSMGTWCTEKEIPLITWEFPKSSIEELSRSQSPVITQILKEPGSLYG